MKVPNENAIEIRVFSHHRVKFVFCMASLVFSGKFENNMFSAQSSSATYTL